MNKIPFISRNKIILITIAITFLIILLAFSLSFGIFGDFGADIQNLNNLINQHKIMFILWHIIIIIAIYFAWEIKINRQIKHKKLSFVQTKKTKKAKNFRWIIIVGIILIDLIMHI